MKKYIITFLIVGLLFFSFIGVSALSANYYYSPNCGHCNIVKPFIQDMINFYPIVQWNVLDITQGSYDVQGTPTLILKTNDNRDITLVGSREIPKYLECELNEMSTLNCPTSSEVNCETNSFFIR